MSSPDSEEDPEEDFANGFDPIPSEEELDAMSARKVARLLATLTVGSAGYIFLSHALNLKMAKLQAKATLDAGSKGARATVIAAVLGALLTFFLGFYFGESQSNKQPPQPIANKSVQELAPRNVTPAPNK